MAESLVLHKTRNDTNEAESLILHKHSPICRPIITSNNKQIIAADSFSHTCQSRALGFLDVIHAPNQQLCDIQEETLESYESMGL